MKIFKKGITWFWISLMFCAVCVVFGYISCGEIDEHAKQITTNCQISALILQFLSALIGCIVGNRYEK